MKKIAEIIIAATIAILTGRYSDKYAQKKAITIVSTNDNKLFHQEFLMY